MKNARLKQWTTFMRHTLNPKCIGKLKQTKKVGEPPEVCAIGAGCIVAGVPHQPARNGSWKFGSGNETASTPHEFAEWLGIDKGFSRVYLDAPFKSKDGQRMQKPVDTINDHWGLSFEQMADLIDFFGVCQSKFGTEVKPYPERL